MHLICALLAADTLPSYCTEKQFKCASGECIPSTFVCDGEIDCRDHSDELQEQCKFPGEFFLSCYRRGQELLRSLHSYWSFPLRTLLLLLLLQQQMSFVRIRNFKHFQKGSPWMLTKKCWFSWPTALEWNFTRCHFLFSQHVCECVWAWPKVKENWILYWAWDLGWMNGHSCAASATCTHSLTLICCQSFVVFQFRKCHRTNHLLSSNMFACVCSCVCVCLLLYWFWCFAICLASLLGK